VSGLVVGAQRRVAERVDVRDRAIGHREENVPAALVRCRLARPPGNKGSARPLFGQSGDRPGPCR
jgi:hypothetical protein